jgi:acyl carrier protein
MAQDVKQTIKEYILSEFLPGENPEELTDDTPLITGGVLDSIATLKLVLFLEERFGVTFEPHELDPEHLDSTAHIDQLVRSKMAQDA